ncbi:MAG: mechanosensitive ion channel family protein [Candidatus Omnitrophica bacterium]|nr:mechanosensitive ion channel family protein [Candidatus Omnitrophota bacterium]
MARRICQRLSAVAAKTAWKWDEYVVEALQRGIPLWSLFLGFYIAVGLWNLSGSIVTGIHRAIYVVLWLSVTFVCAGLAGKLVVLYGSQFQHAMPVTSLTQNIAKILITLLGVLMILHSLGISIAPLLTALGVGGLAVALALQDTLSNLFAGFYLTVEKRVRMGDYIKLNSGEEGYIEDIGWRATRIRMLANNTILVPNSKLAQANITNFNLPSRDLAVLVEVGVDYSSDLSHVERVTAEVGRDVMKTVAGGVPMFEPFIRYHTFGDWSIQLTVILRANEFVDQYLIKHEFIKRLHVRYRQEGITIPFPTQTTVYSKLPGAPDV